MDFTSLMQTGLYDLDQQSLDELTDVGPVHIREHCQRLMHVWVQLRADVFALEQGSHLSLSVRAHGFAGLALKGIHDRVDPQSPATDFLEPVSDSLRDERLPLPDGPP